MKFTVRVPATSANLGPGFDSFGLALQLYNEVTVDTDAEPGVSWEGEGAGELPTDGSDMVSRSMQAFAAHAGQTLPAFAFRSANRIPLERGLGSSSAAVVAGLRAAEKLLDSPTPTVTLLELATEIEGHPDNAAAALLGSFTVVGGRMENDGPMVLVPGANLRPVVLIPQDVRLPTAEARRALPSEVSLGDASFNVAHAVTVALAIQEGSPSLYNAMADRLHESVRLSLIPEVREVFEEIRRAHLPVCVSGAGPSLLAFEFEDRPDMVVPTPGDNWRVLRPGVDVTGAKIL